jgi:hypothetical protein
MTSKGNNKPERTEARIQKLKIQKTQIDNKIALVRNRYNSSRHYLNSVFTDWSANNVSPWGIPLDFTMDNSLDTYNKIKPILTQVRYTPIFSDLASEFECDKLQVCLLENAIVTRQGRKNTRIFRIRFVYNQPFMEAVKTIPTRWFDNHTKSWCIEDEYNDTQALLELLGKFFKIVIDTNNIIVYLNEVQAVHGRTTVSYFRKLPFSLIVKQNEIFSAIKSYRNDGVRGIFIHNGKSFVNLDTVPDIFFTQCPLIPIRYSVTDSQPRYSVYSTLGKCLETISLGNKTKQSLQIIGRYIDSLEALKIPTWTDVPIECDHPDVAMTQYKGFDEFDSILQQLNNQVTDICAAPLVSDYVSLAISGYGADTRDSHILAYVNPYNKDYLARIATFFQYNNPQYPIVFDRSYLTELESNRNFSEFYSTCAHEVSHYIVSELFENTQSHWIEWAIICDILYSVFSGYILDKTSLGLYVQDENLCLMLDELTEEFCYFIDRKSTTPSTPFPLFAHTDIDKFKDYLDTRLGTGMFDSLTATVNADCGREIGEDFQYFRAVLIAVAHFYIAYTYFLNNDFKKTE